MKIMMKKLKHINTTSVDPHITYAGPRANGSLRAPVPKGPPWDRICIRPLGSNGPPYGFPWSSLGIPWVPPMGYPMAHGRFLSSYYFA